VITTAEFLNIAAVGAVIFAAYFIIKATVGTRRGRRAAYYSTRREAHRQASRYISTAFTLFIVAGGLAITAALVPPEFAPPASAPIIAVTASPAGTRVIVAGAATEVAGAKTASVTPSSAATSPVASTSQAQPTVYIVPSVTPKASPTASPVNPSPTPEPTSARIIIPTKLTATDTADKHLTLRAISSGVDAAGQAIRPTTEFTRGVRTIYIVFDFHDVPQGSLLRHTWFRDGGSVHFESATWSHAGVGVANVSWSPGKGFEPGLYEVRLLLGNAKQFTANFVVH
jgi:hypothetical protein